MLCGTGASDVLRLVGGSWGLTEGRTESNRKIVSGNEGAVVPVKTFLLREGLTRYVEIHGLEEFRHRRGHRVIPRPHFASVRHSCRRSDESRGSAPREVSGLTTVTCRRTGVGDWHRRSLVTDLSP